jgi:hypothetical protein
LSLRSNPWAEISERLRRNFNIEQGISMNTSRIVVGTLGGALLSALCFASFSGIVILNSDPGFGVEGPRSEWAYFAAVIGGTMGLLLGLPLGFVIGLLNRGSILGTFFGLLAGLAALIWASQMGGHPDIVYPTIPVLISFLPAGALSGLLTSLLVSRLFSEEPAGA